MEHISSLLTVPVFIIAILLIPSLFTAGCYILLKRFIKNKILLRILTVFIFLAFLIILLSPGFKRPIRHKSETINNQLESIVDEFQLADSKPNLDSEQRLFVENFIDAINTKNINKLKSLTHPECLAYITEENKEFYDFSRWFKRNIPNNYKVFIKEYKPEDILPFTEQFTYPVRPTHMIQIDYNIKENSGAAIMLQVAKQGNGKYLQIIPNPKPETIIKSRETQTQKGK